MVLTFGKINGISRVGDLLRQYMFPWLAFFAWPGTPADKVAFITFASLVQAIPTLTLGHFSARLVRRFSPFKISLFANLGMCTLSLITGLAVLWGAGSTSFVLVMWLLMGFMEMLYYPSRECLYSVLADGDDRSRAYANRSSSVVFNLSRAVMSIVMVVVVWSLGAVEANSIPRGAIAAGFLFDAATFGIVVVFLMSISTRVDSSSRPQELAAPLQGISLVEAAHVRGAIPILICILMLWAFAYSSFYFIFGFYEEFVDAGPRERQMSFYIAMFASAIGGFVGAHAWRLDLRSLAIGLLSVCVVESTVAFTPTTLLSGTFFLGVISFLSILVYTTVFDGIIPQLVQGLDRNAEVSSAITMVKEGLSPIIMFGLAGIASYFEAPRIVLMSACTLSFVVVLVTLCSCKASITSVIEASRSVRS